MLRFFLFLAMKKAENVIKSRKNMHMEETFYAL